MLNKKIILNLSFKEYVPKQINSWNLWVQAKLDQLAV